MLFCSRHCFPLLSLSGSSCVAAAACIAFSPDRDCRSVQGSRDESDELREYWGQDLSTASASTEPPLHDESTRGLWPAAEPIHWGLDGWVGLLMGW